MKLFHLTTHHLLPASKTSHNTRRGAIRLFLEICLDSPVKLTRAQCYDSACLYEIDTSICTQDLYDSMFPKQPRRRRLSKPSLTDQESYFTEKEIHEWLQLLA